MKKIIALAISLLAVAAFPAETPASTSGSQVQAQVQTLAVAPVWSGHSVGFALLTWKGRQFVAFYDADRQLTLAQRNVGESAWKFKKLPSFLGWDSHNYVTLAFDRQNYLHVSGNMHASHLVYFRGTVPLDIDSVAPVTHMTGLQEDRVTYPRFLKGPHGELIFNYREGRSGDGSSYFNVYDEGSKTWRRLMDQPLFDGEGRRNAYPSDPEKGPDGYYHIVWVWRETPDAETNHSLGYARSKDLVHWETIAGTPLALPITLETPGVEVDPIPPIGGIINGAAHVGFDRNQQMMISYYKFDPQGNTQVYFARFKDGQWRHYQATDWAYRWEFWGSGSLPSSDVAVGALQIRGDKLAVTARNVKYGSGLYEVNPVTWRLEGKLPEAKDLLPSSIVHVQSTFPGMVVKWAPDLGEAADGVSYHLRWESLPANRDAPRPKPWPDPVMLQLVTTPQGGVSR